MSERLLREYTPGQQAEALALAQQVGVREAARRLGIPRGTLGDWSRHSGLEVPGREQTEAAAEMNAALAEKRREELKYQLLEKAAELLTRMDRPHTEFTGKDATEVLYPIAPAGAVKDYAISVGILIDKFRLESGEATSRNENRDITHDDHERQALRDAIRSELARRAADGQAAPGADEAAVAADAPTRAGTA